MIEAFPTKPRSFITREEKAATRQITNLLARNGSCATHRSWTLGSCGQHSTAAEPFSTELHL
jgi:hypothetical protein